MTESIENVIAAFGTAVVRRDHEALDVLLAPWIGVNDALDQLKARFEATPGERELPAGSWPTDFEGEAGTRSYDELRSQGGPPPGIDIPGRVDADNYVGWGRIKLLTPKDDAGAAFDAYCNAWFAIVQIAGTYMIGSLELVDPD